MKKIKLLVCFALMLSIMLLSLTSCEIDTSNGLKGVLSSVLGEDSPIVGFFDELAGNNDGDSNTDTDNSNTDNNGDAGDNENEDQKPGIDENPSDDNNDQNGDDTNEPEITTITIAEALELCGESGNITTERYYIRATVKEIKNPAYGSMTVYDETGEIAVYGMYSADGAIGYAEFEYRPVKGDEVLIHCILQNYNGTKEIKNARLISYTKGELDVNEQDYTAMTIEQARAAAKGDKVKVSGVVAAITYANGKIPSGFMLVDSTSSIYVYDRDVTSQVAVGNTVTILGEKDYWILEDEVSAAEKFGYEGCCQLTSPRLIANDNGSSDYDKSWITETTVKNLMDASLETNITTKIYKVNALVKKVVGTGFTNYYFDDLDGVTGSYTYTQCNGSDFTWLDKFDGKICTVYLMVINAKSTASDCVYRFFPVTVIDENYTFNTDDAAKFAVEYYGTEGFLTTYSGDPALEMITSVSSELLGFENATISYASDNTNVVYFTTENGVTVLHCGASGTANVTVTGSYAGKEYSKTVAVTVEGKAEVPSVTVADAIAAEVGAELTVKGIVGPSLVNKVGFYLFNGDDVIAVLTTADVMSTIEIGQEVIITAKRDRFFKDETKHYGQTCLNNATVVWNDYGNHAYSTSGFVTDMTVNDFYNLDELVDYSTTVFTLRGTVRFIKSGYSTQVKVESPDGQVMITIYCSGSGQYSWLQDYVDKEVTLEIAACNWNGKSFYAGCIIAVIDGETKVFNDLNFN